MTRAATSSIDTPAARPQHAVNELLWDFYGEFPVARAEWRELTMTASDFARLVRLARTLAATPRSVSRD
jgi:hypothetical protein